ncbi:MAG: hypothetical protein ACKN9D_02365, partial [Actinomycetales bacterium]
LTGIVVLAVPTLTGYPNNRYFAAPILLWAAAGLIAFDAWLSRTNRRRTTAWALVVLALAYVWASAWPVSELRGTVFPGWTTEIQRITDECTADPNRQVVLQFSPGWPPADLVLPEPTNAVVRCVDLHVTS